VTDAESRMQFTKVKRLRPTSDGADGYVEFHAYEVPTLKVISTRKRLS